MANNMNLNEMLRRMAMAGLGAVTLTVEKSKELADLLIKKGEQAAKDSEATQEQVRDQLARNLKNLADKIHTDIRKAEFEDLLSRMDDLTDEERDIVIDRVNNPVRCAAEDDVDECDEPEACASPSESGDASTDEAETESKQTDECAE